MLAATTCELLSALAVESTMSLNSTVPRTPGYPGGAILDLLSSPFAIACRSTDLPSVEERPP